MKSRVKKMLEQKRSQTARNSRSAVHTYVQIDDSHSVSYQSGRCRRCGKITMSFCNSCSDYYCENHLDKEKEYCENCSSNPIRQDYFG